MLLAIADALVRLAVWLTPKEPPRHRPPLVLTVPEDEAHAGEPSSQMRLAI